MGHNHSHDNESKNIVIAFVLNAIFVVVEIIGGLMTNSVAILSDAIHDFFDCVSIAVAWVFQRKSNKKRDQYYSYGYRRFSLLGSVFLSGVLVVSAVFILIEACKRIFNTQQVDAEGMLWLAIIGVVINGIAALRLKKGHTLNERAVFLHIMEDVLGWVAVLLASVVMMFIELPILDPLLSICITIWVLFNVYKNLRDTFKILLQGVPDGLSVEELTSQITKINGVDSIHDLHIWSQDGNSHVMTIHVVSVSGDTGSIKRQIDTIASKFKIDHVTIEFDTDETQCEYINCKD